MSTFFRLALIGWTAYCLYGCAVTSSRLSKVSTTDLGPVGQAIVDAAYFGQLMQWGVVAIVLSLLALVFRDPASEQAEVSSPLPPTEEAAEDAKRPSTLTSALLLAGVIAFSISVVAVLEYFVADRDVDANVKTRPAETPVAATTEKTNSKTKQVTDCLQIEDSFDRQYCLRKITGRQPLGVWNVRRRTDPIDDSAIITASLRASEGGNSIGRLPTLYMTCASNRTRLWIDWGVYLGADGLKHVTTRIGDGTAVRQTWAVGSTRKSTITGNAIPLIRSMVGEIKLTARVRPAGGHTITTTFDLTGLREVAKQIAQQCSWTLPLTQ